MGSRFLVHYPLLYLVCVTSGSSTPGCRLVLLFELPHSLLGVFLRIRLRLVIMQQRVQEISLPGGLASVGNNFRHSTFIAHCPNLTSLRLLRIGCAVLH
jgi:hypothetical protein